MQFYAGIFEFFYEVCEGYVFTSVRLSTGGYLGMYPPGRYPPQAGTPPPQTGTPLWAGTSQGRYPPEQCMLGYGQQEDGMHPTGMHSCRDNRFGQS